MIGFQPNDSDKQTLTQKPEISNPNPSMVPFPDPDNIASSPFPEMPTIPMENPLPSIGPEITPNQPREL